MIRQITDTGDAGPRVGFIGLGNMGGPMALNLARSGMALSVFDVRPEALVECIAEGARAAATAADLIATVDVLCTCLSDEHQVRDLLLGPSGILPHARKGLVVVIHSTVTPRTIHDIASEAKTYDVKIVDAPVSGASTRSRKGKLTIMVGADDAAFSASKRVLEVVGSPLVRVGGPGDGQVAKLANNIMAVCNQVVMLEAVKFAEAMGMDRELLLQVAAASTGASWAVDAYHHYDCWPTEHPLGPTGELPHWKAKDLRAVLAAADDNKIYLPIVAVCSQMIPPMWAERWAREE